jgi:predicted signal transduction protein with EAL and GGDEF domain
MKKIIDRPQLLFIGFSLIVLISGYANNENSIPLDIGATYILLDVWSASIYSAIFFVLVAVNYAMITIAQKTAKPTLTAIHIVLQIISLIPFLYYFYTADENRNYDASLWMNQILTISFLIFLVGTVLHFFNFIATIIKKKE